MTEVSLEVAFSRADHQFADDLEPQEECYLNLYVLVSIRSRFAYFMVNGKWSPLRSDLIKFVSSRPEERKQSVQVCKIASLELHH